MVPTKQEKLDMLCNSKISKRKITILATSVISSLAVTYFGFILHNQALSVVAPILLAFAPCLVMCAVVGGSMWLVPRLSKNGNHTGCSCGMDHSKTQDRK